jgi:AraC family transcriptional regulator of adaptative response/methylated-DNA-[protein]-cysteine methyltransferase
MTGVLRKSKRIVKPFVNDQARWQAVVNRDGAAEGCFFYSVRTTGVYCRPACPAKLPLRENVRFHATREDAEAAGFRPCKRCRPTEQRLGMRHSAAVAKACRLIEQSDEMPSLDVLADSVGMSRFHFHRVFKTHTGITPKAYAMARQVDRVRNKLPRSRSVTAAIYAAGYSSNGRFYASAAERMGMTPATIRAGGKDVAIRFAVGTCTLGAVLVAATRRGVCAIMLGDEPEQLARDLQDRFPRADLVGGDARIEQWIVKVVGFVETPSIGLDLPLDIRGTAFQERVWQALRQIPLGSTTSYAQIAKRIGQSKSARAVASACGANRLALAIPCHRVVRSDGSLSGYRWGVERKRELLQRERRGKQRETAGKKTT